MTGQWRRLVAAAAALPVVVGLVALPASAETAVPTDALVAQYLFDQDSGTTVVNSAPDASDSPVGDATVVNGQESDWTGDSLRLRGGAKTGAGDWVRLPDNLLSGQTSATVSAEVKPSAAMLSSFHFLWSIGPDATSDYFFASLNCGNGRSPLVGLKSAGTERLVQASSCGLTADTWVNVTSVVDGEAGTASLYLDGTRVAHGAIPFTPADVANQTFNTIGRAPWPDPLFAGEIAAFRVYDRALSDQEVQAVSLADAEIHADEIADSVLAALPESFTTNRDGDFFLPRVADAQWSVPTDSGLTVAEDGLSVSAEQPAAGEASRTTSITLTAHPRGLEVTQTFPVTVIAEPQEDTPYGYLMVHFIEDSAGYAEKIYLDVSRGDNPEYWDPLNGGEPILASNAGTTGVRDPYLTYNPETETYYIIATDLRVFGGDNAGWGAWTTNYSTKMNVWESTDLVTWSDVRQFDVARDPAGAEIPDAAKLGQMWAPEATWVPGYDNGDGTTGAFIVYWSSLWGGNQHIMWGATRDFTQVDWHYGGLFTDNGGHSTIDATLLQQELADGTLRTYRVLLDYTLDSSLVLQSTDAEQWWLAPESEWTTIQTAIGKSRFGAVEGPAMFADHSQERWYLYVDDLPTPGYRPMISTDLDAGFDYLDAPKYFMTEFTKHGGVISLTKADYDRIRQGDAESVLTPELGTFQVEQDATAEDVLATVPVNAEVALVRADSQGRTTAELPITWDLTTVDLTTAGSYEISGVVRSIADNTNTWVGGGGAGVWRATETAQNRPLGSTRALSVSATVQVGEVVAPVESPFVDVGVDNPFFEEIVWLASEGVSTGWLVSDGAEFRPYSNVTRDAMAAFLYRLAGSPEFTAPGVSPFRDVSVSNGFYREIAWLADAGISTGWPVAGGAAEFRPYAHITRDAMAAFLYRYSGEPDFTAPAVSPFVDVTPATPFYREITWLADTGVSTGWPTESGQEYRPVAKITRDAMAAFLHRLTVGE